MKNQFTKKAVAILITIFIFITSIFPAGAQYKIFEDNDTLLKQHTSITCTLASAAMIMRRTALAAGRDDWESITEESIKSTAWYNGVGLIWDFTYENITVGHMYFQTRDKKQEIIDMLKKYPQGVVVYNNGSHGQTHAIVALDYDKTEDILYVADPSNAVKKGRIPISASSIVGNTQEEQINNLNAFWFVSSPDVSDTLKNSPSSPPTDYTKDENYISFENTKKEINDYFVINSPTPATFRRTPTGSGEIHSTQKYGTIIKITEEGKNKSGALWYKTTSGVFVYSTNLIPLEEYSKDIKEFKKTKKEINTQYVVRNDITAKFYVEPISSSSLSINAPADTKIQVSAIGNNTENELWVKTEDNLYILFSSIKKSEETQENNEKGIYVVTATSLNFRKSPTTDSTILGSISNGTFVHITEVKNGWGKLIHNNVTGWVSMTYLSLLSSNNSTGNEELIELTKENFDVEVNVETGVGVNSRPIWTITCTKEVVGLSYTYDIYKDDKLLTTIESENNTFAYQLTEEGKYYVVANATYGDTVISVTSRTIIVFSDLQIDSIELSRPENMSGYNEVQFVCTASGGKTPYEYRYTVYKDDNIIYDTDFIDNYVFIYTFEEEGSYKVECTVKDDVSQKESAFSQQITVTAFQTGDVNLDGKVSASDARLTLRVAALLEELPEKQFSIADINCDGKITSSDARKILRIAALLE